MEYKLLSQAQMDQIAHQKLLELEAEHARMELDLKLAAATGVHNDAVVQAEYQFDVLVQQIATLTSWLTPPPVDDEPDEVSSNGREPAKV